MRRRSSRCCPAYGDRDELGALANAVSAGFNDDRRELLAAGEALEAELSGEPDPVARNADEKGISLHELERVARRGQPRLRRRLRRPARPLVREAARPRARGRCRPRTTRAICAASLRSRQTYTKEQRRPGLRRDARRARPRHRAARPGSGSTWTTGRRSPARLRDRLRSAERRPSDHARPGRPPRLPGVPARGRARAPLRGRRPGAAVHLPQAVARPRADRDLQLHRGGDLARAGLARRALRALRRAGAARMPRRRSSSRRCCSAATRRSSSSSSSSGAASARTAARPAATRSGSPAPPGIRYPAENYLSDMDSGFYSADYLRAWIRSAQLRQHLVREVGEDWWRSPETGERLRELFREGTRPTSEEIAARIGYEPLDTAPLAARARRVAHRASSRP